MSIGRIFSLAANLFSNSQNDDGMAANQRQVFFSAASLEGWQAQLFTNLDRSLRQDAPPIEFDVPVPADGNPLTIRDYILTRELGYTPADILALDDATPGDEFIISPQSAERWATRDEVKNFRRDEQGLTSIPVNAELIKSLSLFRERRHAAGIQADKLTASIADASTRQTATEALTRLFSYDSSPSRTRAAIALSALAQGNGADAAKLADIIGRVAAAPEHQTNPALQLALARTTAFRIQAQDARTYGPKPPADYTAARQQLSRALEAVATTGSREEAALINHHATEVLKLMGDTSEAQYREMIGRFYEVDEGERQIFDRFDEFQLVGMSIPRWKETANGSIRPLTPEEARLQAFDKGQTTRPDAPERDPALGKAQNAKRMSDHRIENEGTLQNRIVSREDQGEVFTGRRATESQRQANAEAFTRETYRHQQVNPQGVERGQNRVGALDLVNTVLSYAKLYNQTKAVEQRNALRAPLEQAAQESTRFGVPPRPSHIERLMAQLAQSRATTTDVKLRSRIDDALQGLKQLKEMSDAFWGQK